jgi:hypothetical protein
MIFSCLEQLLTISYLICGSEKSDMQKQTGDSSILAQEYMLKCGVLIRSHALVMVLSHLC